VMKILVDRSESPSAGKVPDIEALVDQAFENYQGGIKTPDSSWKARLFEFLAERLAHLFERRGYSVPEARAVSRFWKRPDNALARVEAIKQVRGLADFVGLAEVAKRVNNITREHKSGAGLAEVRPLLTEPAEVALADEIDQRWPKVHDASGRWQYGEAMKEIVKLRGPLDRFFTEVLVMTDDARVRAARLSLLTMVRDTINAIADISEVAPEDVKQA